MVLAVAAAVAAGAVAVVAWQHGNVRRAAATTTLAVPVVHPPTRRPKRARIARLAEQSTGRLAAPVQDAAGAALADGRVMLAGGLTAADTSRADVRLVSASSDRAAGFLPTGIHDTAAVAIGRHAYVFGGGTAANTQSDQIVRLPSTVVGRLPNPSSDQSAAVVGGAAYVVGGYTGSAWLDTIVAWRPGTTARVVAHLPYPLRYAAVAADGNRIVIAGGSLVDGSASSAILLFTPATRRVTRLGSLPAATTHAAAAMLHGIVYVIGGRSATLDTPTDRIVAVDPATHRVRPAGSLTTPTSDLTAVPLRNSILLAGGRSAGAAQDGLALLRPATRTIDVYAYDGADRFTAGARGAKSLVYVPNSESNTVSVIDPATYHVIRTFRVGTLPQHVVPAWDLRTLYVTNDVGNSLTAIDPRTGKPTHTIRVDDPYNMYFTPNGRYAIVVAERMQRLDFRDAHTFRLHKSLAVPCYGVDHMDFTADGRELLASCEFSGRMVVVDVPRERVVRTIVLPGGGADMPQDVKLSPDGRLFYVADMHAGGVWEIDAHSFRVLGFLATGAGAHGLYPSRDARDLYVSNRSAGTVSVVSFATRRIVATWRIPGGSPDMGGVSANGKVLWLSGRYNSEVYAISTHTGRLLARIPVGAGPHGVCVWPQPGRYSLGHTGILR